MNDRPQIIPVRPNILDGSGQPMHHEPQTPVIRTAPWWPDINTKSLHNINGHWFRVTDMGPRGLVMMYDHPSRKAARIAARRAGERKEES